MKRFMIWALHILLLAYWNVVKVNPLTGAELKGIEKGRAEERMGNARKMKAKGYATEDIADITGLTAEEVEAL